MILYPNNGICFHEINDQKDFKYLQLQKKLQAIYLVVFNS